MFFANLKDSVLSFVDRWVRFFSPVPGWDLTYLAFRSGQTAWEVPGRPDANRTVPWPMQWIPHVPVAKFVPSGRVFVVPVVVSCCTRQ